MTFLVGIAGPSCSGKSEVARRLSRILRAPILALDHYYLPLSHLSPEERARRNFDSPDALDAELICTHVRALRNGLPAEEPTYDFVRHTRAEEKRTVDASEYVIVEGLFTLYWAEVRRMLDYKVYIGADHDTCLARRIFRDLRERGRSEESVRAQYAATVQPMADQFVAPTAAHADLVLEGLAPIKQSVYSILRGVASHLGDSAYAGAVRQALDIWHIAVEDAS